MKVLKHLGFAASMLWATSVVAEDLVVFAAASLKGPLDAIAADFGDVRVAYGGSGTLARQVQQGAPADVILLANAAWMDVLIANEAVVTAGVFARNRLVVIAPAGAEPLVLTADTLSAALEDGRLATGFVAAVPAGIYGKAALTHLGLWDTVEDKIAEVDNVRAAVALVARGEVPLAIGYQSDALLVEGVTVVATFPDGSHPTVAYWGGVVAGAQHPEATAFLAALMGPEAQQILQDAGFCAVDTGCAP